MRWRHLLFNGAFFLNCLLIFLLITENRLVLPAWLQVTGRMHPLLLHFPIVLLIGYVFLRIVSYKKTTAAATVRAFADDTLLLGAFTAALTALMGLFLSKEPGYDADTLVWHKWSGAAVAVISTALYYWRNRLQQWQLMPELATALTLAMIIFTGHQGAGITHGQNFLLAPIMPEEIPNKVALEDAVVFTDMVNPILKNKCMSCHNSKKAKGELIMETADLLLKGGKTGPLWEKGEPGLSLLLQRLHLPLEEKKHMPPQGRPQLTEDEIQILYSWIKKGADFKMKVIDLAPTDTLRLLANAIFKSPQEEVFDFEKASEETIRELSNNYRVVTPVALGSPAVEANFFNREMYEAAMLKELLPLKGQLVALNLSYMPVKDEDLATIQQFKQLRTLNLNFTGITGNTLNALKQLPFLKELSLSGTAISKEKLAVLHTFTSLKKVSVWNTAISPGDIAAMKKENRSLQFETGFRSDTVVLKLSPPVFQNEEQVISAPLPLKLKHYIQGTTIRYTLNGEEPDSITAPVYDGKVVLNKNTLVKVKAFRQGWYSSDVIQRFFYKSTYQPDSIYLGKAPDPKYKGDGGKTLIDQEKGDFNIATGKWLGYRHDNMEAWLFFHRPVNVENVSLSALRNIDSYLFPPAWVEIWGGTDPQHLKLLKRVVPVQPQPKTPVENIMVEAPFSAVDVRCIKVVAQGVSKLPGWHAGKGQKGWIFIDEIFVN